MRRVDICRQLPRRFLQYFGCSFLKSSHHPPSVYKTQRFIDVCHKYSIENPKSIIGVHCTHGFNRTGFLICAYLINKFNYSAKDALEYFSEIRPPGIYRQALVDALYERYGNRNDPVPIVREVPFWKELADGGKPKTSKILTKLT
jgi:mRNA-capping enzyme